MKSILCFNDKPCPFRGEWRAVEEIGLSSRNHLISTCNAKSIEEMRACILDEDPDIKKYGIKVLVKRSDGVKAWEPTKVILQRHDTDEVIDGEVFAV